MKNRIPNTFIQELVERTDIVTLVGARIDLKKKGDTHTAVCPFHSEKTPSFTVSQRKQFYYCFGCSAHGNAIGFLMEYDRLSFVDAVTYLAERLGLKIPYEITDQTVAQFSPLYTLLDKARQLYQKQLAQMQIAITYLKSRGLTGQTAKDFAIGFAPDSWDFLAKALGQKKQDQIDLITAGMLIEKNPTRPYDRFRGRIVFPIRDIRGRTIGFGGRTMGDELPKYLNSPETPVFHKNNTLYGLYEACKTNRTLKRALVTEGYLDVISLAQHGVNYAVATLGTALNVKHIQQLLRYTSEIIFCFDGDEAGKKAAWKALTISLPLLRDGLNLRFLFLSASEDPDSMIKKIGKEKFENLVDKAPALSDVFFTHLETTTSIDSIAGRAAYAKIANEHLQTMPEGIYKNLLLDQLTQRLGLARKDLSTLKNTGPQAPVPQPEEECAQQTVPLQLPKLGERLTPVQLAIHLLLLHPKLAASANKSPAIAFSEKTPEKTLLKHLVQRFTENPNLNIGDLLTECEDKSQCSFIATIAALPVSIPAEGIQAEFLGALKRLHEHDQAHQLSHLIAKAKQSELTHEEKQRLQLLLAKKQADYSVETE